MVRRSWHRAGLTRRMRDALLVACKLSDEICAPPGWTWRAIPMLLEQRVGLLLHLTSVVHLLCVPVSKAGTRLHLTPLRQGHSRMRRDSGHVHRTAWTALVGTAFPGLANVHSSETDQSPHC